MPQDASDAAGLVQAYELHLRGGGTLLPKAFLAGRGAEDASILEALEVAYAIHATPGEARMLGPYQLGPEIGRGAQGTVHAAVDTRLGRRVALKLLKGAALENDETRLRFQREAEAAGRVVHPNVCAVYEAGSHEGQPFIAMQFIDGPPLSEVLSSGGVPSTTDRSDHLRYVEHVAHGLSAAHAAGLIHRDVKPGNILLAPEGLPVLVDFGLARLADTADSRLTQTGDMRGTPAYMAPEQIRGCEAADARSDVYSLGVVAYEAVSGERPFDGATWSVLFHQILTEEPARPARCPGDLWIVLETALAKDPDQRYATAAAFAEDLRRIREHEPIRARPVGPWTRLRRWTRRRPAVALALLLVLGGSLAFALQQRAAAQRLTREVAATDAAREHADQRAYLANIRAADASLANDDVAEARRRLRECPPARRGWEWNYLQAGLDQSLGAVAAHTGAVRDLALSPDRTIMVSAGDDGRICLWRTGDETPYASWTDHHAGQVVCAVFSPDGKQLATGGEGGGILLWELDGTIQARLVHHESHVWSLAYTPDGRTLLSGSTDNSFAAYDLERAELRYLLPGQAGTVRTLVVSSDSRRAWFSTTFGHTVRVALATGETSPVARHYAQAWCAERAGHRMILGLSDNTVRVIDLRTNAELAVLRGHRRRVTCLAIMDHGRVATGSLDGSIRVWDLAMGTLRRTLIGHSSSVRSLLWHPRTAELTSGGDDGTLRRWLVAPSIAQVRSIHTEGHAAAVSFHPDGRTLATSGYSGRIYLHDTWTGDVRHIFRGHGARVRDLAHTPDGARLVSVSDDGQAHVWDLASGLRRHRLGGGRALAALAMHPRGGVFAAAGTEGCVRLWEADSGHLLGIHASRPEPIVDLAFDPTGALLAIARPERFSLYELSRRITRWTLSLTVKEAVFSPDGAHVALAIGPVVQIHRVADGKREQTLRGHDQKIESLAYHPDGGRLATGAFDQTVRLWDTRDGTTVCVLRQSTSWVRAVAWSRGGSTIAAAASDRSLQMWHARKPAGFDQTMRVRQSAMRSAAPLVDALYRKHRDMHVVVEAISAHRDLAPAVREAARHLAQLGTREDALTTRRGRLMQLVLPASPRPKQRDEIMALERLLSRSDPEERSTLVVRSLARFRGGEPASALALIRAFLQSRAQADLGPPSATTLAAYALILLANGDLALGIEQLARAEACVEGRAKPERTVASRLIAEVRGEVQSKSR